MPQNQQNQVQATKLRCRFEMTATDAPSSYEFCVFDFPGCEGCPKAPHTVRTVGSSEDPMKSEALRAWAARGLLPSPIVIIPVWIEYPLHLVLETRTSLYLISFPDDCGPLT